MISATFNANAVVEVRIDFHDLSLSLLVLVFGCRICVQGSGGLRRIFWQPSLAFCQFVYIYNSLGDSKERNNATRTSNYVAEHQYAQRNACAYTACKQQIVVLLGAVAFLMGHEAYQPEGSLCAVVRPKIIPDTSRSRCLELVKHILYANWKQRSGHGNSKETASSAAGMLHAFQ